MTGLKQLVARQDIPNADATLATVPTGKAWTIKQISLYNHTGGGVAVDIYVEVVGSKAVTNVIKQNTGAGVAAYTLEIINLSERLTAGHGITAGDNGAGGNNVNIAVFGVEEDV